MRDLLLSVGYDRWILPALLLIPVLGAADHLDRRRRAREHGGRADGGRGTNADAQPSRRRRFARWVALLTFSLEFVLSVGLWWTFDPATAGWQCADLASRGSPTWGMNFTLGIDGIALVLILLTTLLMPLTVLGSWTSVREKVPAFYALMLILTTRHARRVHVARPVPVLRDVGS